MNRFEFAQSLIRAPLVKRLTDRSFLLAIAVALVGLYLFMQKAINGTQFVDLLQWTVGPWILAEKAKDAFIGYSASKPEPEKAATSALTIGGLGPVSFAEGESTEGYDVSNAG